MLTTNSWNDKLATARVDFSTHGMLNSTCLGEVLERLCDHPEDTTDDDSDGDGDGDDGQDLDADGDEEVTGPVDGPSALSEVTIFFNAQPLLMSYCSLWISSYFIPGTWLAYQAREPCISRPDFLVLSTEPCHHRDPSNLRLSNH